MSHENKPIASYPLQWPAGWKRTEHAWRVRAKFGKAGRSEGYEGNRRWIPSRDLTITEGTERVLLELKRMGLGRDDIVISTNLVLRLDGLPRGGQGEPADPGAAVYWEDSARQRKVMAIDVYDRVADNLAAVAATLDAMRAIERHGGAVVLERAFTGFTALPAPIVAGMKRPWRDVLDLGHGFENVTPDIVNMRYRTLAGQWHPDRGGSNEKMAELNAARDDALKELGA